MTASNVPTGAPGSAPGPTTGAPGSAPNVTTSPATGGVTAPADATKVEPKAKVKKAKVKKAAAADGAARPRLPKYPDDHVITVIKENAKARGAADRFKRYTTGMTVRAYADKIKEDFGRTEGQTFADMRWDEDHKFIHIGPTVIEVPKPEPAPAKAEAKAEATPTPPAAA